MEKQQQIKILIDFQIKLVDTCLACINLKKIECKYRHVRKITADSRNCILFKPSEKGKFNIAKNYRDIQKLYYGKN